MPARGGLSYKYLSCHGKILPNSYYILATMDPMARFLLRSYQDVSLFQDRILPRQKNSKIFTVSTINQWGLRMTVILSCLLVFFKTPRYIMVNFSPPLTSCCFGSGLMGDIVHWGCWSDRGANRYHWRTSTCCLNNRKKRIIIFRPHLMGEENHNVLRFFSKFCQISTISIF